MKILLLIDANSLIHRTFHALPPLTAPDGRPTQSLYGVSNVLLKIFREEKPDYAAALFDRPEKTFRKEKFEAYKAQRPKAPDDLVSQIIEARTLFKKFGIRTYEAAGYEADDLIATLATKFSAGGGSSSGGKDTKNLQVMILTGDLDTLQLVEGKKLVVRTFRKGISDTFVYDEQAVCDRYGLRPEQLVDFKALVGDQSDNIPGVSGVGEKTAAELLKKYGTLDGVYENLSKEPKLGRKLEGKKKEAEFSRSLVVLERHVPLELKKIDELEVSGPGEEVKNYFQSLGFESLVKRLQGEPLEVRREKDVQRFEKQGSIFEGVAMDREKIPSRGEVFISGDGGGREDFRSDKLKVGFGLKSMLKKFWARGDDLRPPYFDLEVAFWLLDPDFKDYSPAASFKRFLNKKWSVGPPSPRLWRVQDGDLKRAYEFCAQKLQEYEMEGVFRDIEMPLVRVLAEMEDFGIGVDIPKLKNLEQEIDLKLGGLTREIYKLSGEEFNINSPQQLSKVLFQKLGLGEGRTKKTAGGADSTREEVLLDLRGRHPVIDPIIEYRESFKILSTYVGPFQELALKDGRIHTDYIQTGTATGRLSSQAPNMQNIPKGAAWAGDLRTAFEAGRGSSFVSFDYSQIELRILASMTGDKNMIEVFREGQDIHRMTASRVLGVSPEEVGSEERRLAKVLNFGLVYGMGVTAFARASGLSRSKAQEFIDAYFREFSRIREWQEEIKEQARRDGYVKTMTGRRRYLGGLDSGAPRLVAEAERAAINMPLQGLSADIIKMAMIQISNKFHKENLGSRGVMMLLTIHDELLFEVPDDMIRKIVPEVRGIMENIFELEVPLRVEASVGKNWGHMEEISNANYL